jgi:hypothetical protein
MNNIGPDEDVMVTFQHKTQPLDTCSRKIIRTQPKHKNFVKERIGTYLISHAIIDNYEKLNTKYGYVLSSFRAY